ncbi:Aste57867_14602 [Aphanomyces stellatus]|uniref:Aste57867_14602 protein n=1 Tax=Aphanomyces stellatus TaxID=120398 RepID=A0A485L2S8_9STRA|nr:hypothetical protein As57867_014548 [Aphanomyces stellatus]VFT91421.1 Aste57867_14602 [Aphanomyces stellatus]
MASNSQAYVTLVEEATPQRKPDAAPRRDWLPLAIVIALVVSMVVAFLSIQVAGDQDRESNGYHRLYANPSNDTADNTLTMRLVLANANIDSYDVSLSVQVEALPRRLVDSTTHQLTQPCHVQVGTGTFVLDSTTPQPFASWTIKHSFVKGNPSMYPFDSYDTAFAVRAIVHAANGSSPLVVAFSIATPDSFAWHATVERGDATDSVVVRVHRHLNVYIVLLFVGIWAVTIAVGYIGSMQVVWKRRAPDNPVIFLSALIAVPIFRNTAPGSPPYGCLFDILSTFVSFAVILTFLVFVTLAFFKPKPSAAQPPV